MAIRFQCGSCSQPIEVDDEWASKAVACPYCRKTITAPADSTITDLSQVPAASPLAADDAAAALPPDTSRAVAAVTCRPNRMAVVSLALACAVVFQLVLASMVLESHRLEMESVQKRVESLRQEGVSPLVATQRASLEFYEEHGGAPPVWMMAGGMLYVGGGLMWVATIVCALIAVRRPLRRGLAVTALVVAGLVPILFCCGALASG